mmetsp:Transcript_43884/g.75859  ORF Transcript_43884/g.75859 Transcript_43884/m.75859 type:complete len:106 (-) Transcript_43884:312-629(-)
MQRTSCWGMSSSAADADDALLIKTGVEVQLLPVAIICWLCPFSLGKEGRGGYGRWPVPMDNSNCHNDGSLCKKLFLLQKTKNALLNGEHSIRSVGKTHIPSWDIP